MVTLMKPKAKSKSLEQLDWPQYGEIKYDGVRLSIIVSSSDGKHVDIKTYNKKSVKSAELTRIFSELPDGLYDGEVIAADGKQDKRTKISGAVNSAIKGGNLTMKDKCLVLFDYLTPAEVNQQECVTPYYIRRSTLRHLLYPIVFKYNIHGRCPVTLAYAIKVSGKYEAAKLYRDTIAEGFEGIILKEPKHLYVFKRSTAWTRLKETKTADLKCIDTIEGTGKYEGMIGSLVCTGIVEGVDVLVKVGSGLSDSQRALPPLDYLDKTIEVKYNCVSVDAVTKKHSLFLPRFNCVRFDK